MKKWIAASLLLTMTPSANATYREVEQVAKVCRMISEIGEGIMAMRQGGHTKEEIRSRGEPSAMIDQLVNAAFNIPDASDPKQRGAVTNSFKRDVYISCLQDAADQ